MKRLLASFIIGLVLGYKANDAYWSIKSRIIVQRVVRRILSEERTRQGLSHYDQ